MTFKEMLLKTTQHTQWDNTQKIELPLIGLGILTFELNLLYTLNIFECEPAIAQFNPKFDLKLYIDELEDQEFNTLELG